VVRNQIMNISAYKHVLLAQIFEEYGELLPSPRHQRSRRRRCLRWLKFFCKVKQYQRLKNSRCFQEIFKNTFIPENL
jgi:hypothetical protein